MTHRHGLMSQLSTTARLLLTVAVVSGLVGCDGGDGGDDATPTPSTTGSASSSTCVTAGSERDSMQLTVPAGFADRSEDSILDASWARQASDGTGSPDVVGLDAYSRDASDQAVVQRAMAAAPEPPDSGVPAYDKAVDRVEREQLSEATWTAPNRGDPGEHTGYVALRREGDTRFTVTIVASTDTFEALKSEVLDTVQPGDCAS